MPRHRLAAALWATENLNGDEWEPDDFAELLAVILRDDRQVRGGQRDLGAARVAILGHPRGRPPASTASTRRPPPSSCDPQSPRRATVNGQRHQLAERHVPVAILGCPGERPPAYAAAKESARTGRCDTRQPPEGDRHRHRHRRPPARPDPRAASARRATASPAVEPIRIMRYMLPSSATSKGDRQRRARC